MQNDRQFLFLQLFCFCNHCIINLLSKFCQSDEVWYKKIILILQTSSFPYSNIFLRLFIFLRDTTTAQHFDEKLDAT